MFNLLDYLKTCPNKKLDSKSFTEVDGLLFAEFSYLRFENFISKKNLPLKFKQIANDLALKFLNIDKMYRYEFINLALKYSTITPRYMDTEIVNFKASFSEKYIKQFFGISFIINDLLIISFRGTDTTFVGWREDIDFGIKDDVLCQKDAKKYVDAMAKAYPDKKIVVVGHSKGGNLALYGSIFAESEVRDRILTTYNYDGPGMSLKNYNSTEYITYVPKIKSYTTSESLFGLLMYHQEDIICVKSSNKGILKHEAFSWQIEKNHFVKDKLSDKTIFIATALNNWMNAMTKKQKQEFFDTIFAIGSNNGQIKNFQADLNASRIFNGFKQIQSLSKPERKAVLDGFSLLYDLYEATVTSANQKIPILIKFVAKRFLK